MRRVLLLAAAVTVALTLTASATAQYDPPQLAKVASVFAQQPVTVTCASSAEDAWLYFAWGYVFLQVPHITMSDYLCDSILDVNDQSYGLRRKALAVLVLVHEAYHLRVSWAGRASEARTECKAIRHVRYAAQFLGAPYEYAMRLRDQAILWHKRLVAVAPEYNQADCKLPA